MLGRTTFKVNGKTYECAFTARAMQTYERDTDQPFMSIAKAFEPDKIQNLKIDLIVNLFVLAVSAVNRAMTEDEILDLTDHIVPMDMISIVSDALVAAFPEASGDTSKKPQRAAPSKK